MFGHRIIQYHCRYKVIIIGLVTHIKNGRAFSAQDTLSSRWQSSIEPARAYAINRSGNALPWLLLLLPSFAVFATFSAFCRLMNCVNYS